MAKIKREKISSTVKIDLLSSTSLVDHFLCEIGGNFYGIQFTLTI